MSAKKHASRQFDHACA